jgi:hypothetical protein
MESEFQTRPRTLRAEMPAPFRTQYRAVAKAIVIENSGKEFADEMEKQGIF